MRVETLSHESHRACALEGVYTKAGGSGHLHLVFLLPFRTCLLLWGLIACLALSLRCNTMVLEERGETLRSEAAGRRKQ